MFLIVPEIANSITTIANSVKEFPQTLHQWSLELMNWMPQAAVWLENIQFDFNIDWQKTIIDLISFLQNGAGNVLNTTFNVAASIFSGLVTGFLAIVFSFYLLLNKEKLGSQVKQILYACLKEEHADYLVRVGNMANRTFSNFLSGQCLEAVILGSLFFITMSILQFPYALMISVLIAFTALIPVFGAFIGCFIGAFLILLVNPIRAIWFVVLFLCLQQFEGNVIYPKVVGGSVGIAGNLGTGSSYSGWKYDGCCGNADLYSGILSSLQPDSRGSQERDCRTSRFRGKNIGRAKKTDREV